MIRKVDTVARFGGDEFVVLLFAPENENYVSNVVQRISQQVDTSYFNQSQTLTIGSSIGIAMFPEGGLTAEALMMNSDRAMYREKSLNKGELSSSNRIKMSMGNSYPAFILIIRKQFLTNLLTT